MKHSQPPGENGRNEVSLPRLEAVPVSPLLPSAGPEPQTVRVLEYWHILKRHKRFVLLSILGCALIAWMLTLAQTPIYRARVTLEVLPESDSLSLNGDSQSHSSDREETAFVRNQVEILKSESLLERVIAKLQLDKDLHFTRGPSRLSRFTSLLTRTPADPTTPKQRALRAAAHGLNVSLSPESDIIEVSFDGPDKEQAAAFANTLADEYIEQNLSVRWEASQRTAEWLTKQLRSMQDKLTESEHALEAYSDQNQLVFINDNDSVAGEELRRVQEELSKALADRIQRQSRYEMASSSPPESLPEVLDDNVLRQYQVDLTMLRRRAAELSASPPPDASTLKSVQAQVAELETTLERERLKIIQRLKNEFQAASRREKLLSDRYDEQLKLVSGESSKATRYNLMKREVDTNRDLYQALTRKVKEAGVASAIRTRVTRIVDRAKPPLSPIKPDGLFNAGLGLCLGLFLGVSAAFLRERSDRTVKIPGEMQFHLRVPELGVIPRFDRQSGKRPYFLAAARGKSILESIGLNGAKSGSNGHSNELVTWQREPTVSAESFRAALTSILFSGNGNPPAVISVSSPQSGEGKTTVISNLAVALAEINRRVLVIDGDLRRPRLDRVLGEPNGWGLSDLLRESEPLHERPLDFLVQRTKIPNVHAVFSGRRTNNASNLLHSPRLAELLRRFRQEFDAILIDAPPVLGLPDARVLGHLSDGVILVLRANKTTLESARAARQRLGEDGTIVLGTILNAWDPNDTRYGYSYSTYAYEPDPASLQAAS